MGFNFVVPAGPCFEGNLMKIDFKNINSTNGIQLRCSRKAPL
jgi:hypothetical protein